jgi:hypothetical protein
MIDVLLLLDTSGIRAALTFGIPFSAAQCGTVPRDPVSFRPCNRSEITFGLRFLKSDESLRPQFLQLCSNGCVVLEGFVALFSKVTPLFQVLFHINISFQSTL